MQFQISCKSCKQNFGIDAIPGQTIRCNCPYCGSPAIVATPGTNPQPTTTTQPVSAPKKISRSKIDWHFGRKVTVVFLALAALFAIVLSGLYIVFSAMSN